jgi:hypothetical protein
MSSVASMTESGYSTTVLEGPLRAEVFGSICLLDTQ